RAHEPKEDERPRLLPKPPTGSASAGSGQHAALEADNVMLLSGRHAAWEFSPPARTARPRTKRVYAVQIPLPARSGGRPTRWTPQAMQALCECFADYARYRRHDLPAEQIYRALVRDVYPGLRPSTLRRRHSEARARLQK